MKIVDAIKSFSRDDSFNDMIRLIINKCELVENINRDDFDKYFEHLNIIYDDKLEDSIEESANIGKYKNIRLENLK